jgi:hypothetical protein
VAFVFKYVRGNAIFIATLIGEGIVLWIRLLTEKGVFELSYLWLNPIGCILVVGLALAIQLISNQLLLHKK